MFSTIIKIKYLLLLLLLTVSIAYAQQIPCNEAPKSCPTKLTLKAMIHILMSCNPQIIQAHYNYLAAKAQVPQTLAPNNPQFNYISNPAELGPPGYVYAISQSVPFFGKKRLAAAIANDQAKIANTQTQALLLQLIAQLKINFFQLLLQEKQERITRHTIDRLELIKRVARARYANNAAAFVDYLNAQVTQSNAQNDLFALTQQIIITRANLNVLIGRCPDMPLQLDGEIEMAHLPKTALTCMEQESLFRNPNVKGAEFQVAAARKNLTLSKLGYFPDFNLILDLGSSYPPMAGIYKTNTVGFEIDITIPLWFMFKERYGVDQARASLIASKAGDVSLRQQTQLGVTTAYANLRQAVEQSNFISTRQLPQAREAFRLALTNYSTYSSVTTIAFNDLMVAQNNLHQTLLAAAQSNVAALQAYANLEMSVGGKLY